MSLISISSSSCAPVRAEAVSVCDAAACAASLAMPRISVHAVESVAGQALLAACAGSAVVGEAATHGITSCAPGSEAMLGGGTEDGGPINVGWQSRSGGGASAGGACDVEGADAASGNVVVKCTDACSGYEVGAAAGGRGSEAAVQAGEALSGC